MNTVMEQRRDYGGWQLQQARASQGGRFASTITVMALTLAYCVGTGGDADPNFWANKQVYGYRNPIVQGNLAKAAIRTNTHAEKLQRVREVFKPSGAGLAEVFGVSRQAIYKWLSGESISAEHLDKLDDLEAAATLLSHAGVTSVHVLKRKIHSGKSVMEIAKSGGSAAEAAQRLLSILQVETAQRLKLEQRLAGRTDRLTVGQAVGIPMLSEQA